MAEGPIRALTGRRRTRLTSTGCRNPWQPEPGRAPLIAAQAAVQTNGTTSEAPPEEVERALARVGVLADRRQLLARSRIVARRQVAATAVPALEATQNAQAQQLGPA